MITKDMVKLSPECLSLVQNTAHTLIAGTTGSGKSVLLNTILYSLLKGYHEGLVDEVKFYLVDTKRIELKPYKDHPDTLRYITEPEEAPDLLDDAIDEMENRYASMVGKESDAPETYIVIDELADLLDTPGVLERIVKIGRLGRAAHIHLLCCTQDPSRRTLSAQLMQNMTTCVALRCKNEIESKQIIGIKGAEELPRHGKAIVSDQDGYHVITIPLTPDKDIFALIKSDVDDWQRMMDEIAEEQKAARKASLIDRYGDKLWRYRKLRHTAPARGRRVAQFYSCLPIKP